MKHNTLPLEETVAAPGVSRRRFLGYAGAVTGAAALLSACNNDDDEVTPTTSGAIDLGKDDGGILNYAYALEQLESAFYIQVIERQGTGIYTSEEIARLTEIRDHEVAHAEFFKKALGTSAIQGLTPLFTEKGVDFGNRASVLATGKAFEDLGVSAYNGAGRLLKDVNFLLVAGKIVSVEARHAAYIRELITPGSFATADVVNAMGLEISRKPSEVLPIAQMYIKETLSGANLPSY